MRLADFDFDLPESLVAQVPVSPRDGSRLLVLPAQGPAGHRAFSELPELLRAGDLLVFNDTRVVPARLLGIKAASGGKVEMLLVEPAGPGLPRRWRALGQAATGLRPGTRLLFGELRAQVIQAEGEGFFELELDREGAELAAALERHGRLPLPPYIRRAPTAEDAERYQTIFAKVPGSSAAPTAGLHFTQELLDRLAARGVERATVTLHVGPGTFLPVRGDSVEAHRMHEERYRVGEAAARAVAACRRRGGRCVAVGTTAVRTLESAWRDGELQPGEGRTALFVRPGHAFGAIDLLVTNFHLPRSTLLMLVCAFAGQERVLGAYREAVEQRYRFFSYGDAMLLERGSCAPVR